MADNEAALRAKGRGNRLFQEAKFGESAKEYEEAARLDPKCAVYPSNLSAALYELGDYDAAVRAVLKSLSLQPESTLELRLSARLARGLSHGVKNGSISPSFIEENLDAIQNAESVATNVGSRISQDWGLWKLASHDLASLANVAYEDRVRLSKMPIFKASPDSQREYFLFGMDEIISLVHGWGSQHPDPLNLAAFSQEQLGQLAFFIGGAADARHVYGTMIGLNEVRSKLNATQRRSIQLHLTVNDVHFAPTARILLHLLILDKLLSPHLNELTRLELEAALVYTYVSWIVPDYVSDRVKSLSKEAKERLLANPPDLPGWLHVDQGSIAAIIQALDFWMGATNLDTKKLLDRVRHQSGTARTEEAFKMTAGMVNVSEISARLGAGFDPFQKDRRDAERIANLPEPHLMRLLGGATENTRDLVSSRNTPQGKKKLVEFLTTAAADGVLRWGLVWESEWYKDVNAFVPHGKLIAKGKHPGFEYFRDFASQKGHHKEKTSKLAKSVLKTWKPNITLFEGESEGDPYPEDGGLDDFEFIGRIAAFNEEHGLKVPNLPAEREWPVFAHVMTFFWGVMDTIKSLQDNFKLEIICGEINSELSKMRLGADASRPFEFPRKFTRMWVSNIPDYTQGTLGMAMYMVPALQNATKPAVASNCLLNTGAWRNDAEFCFNYTMLLPRDLRRFLGVQTINDKPLLGILSLGATSLPRPLTSLASRSELHAWLGRLLLWLICPGSPKHRPVLIMISFNLVAFVQLLVELTTIGYPSHWIAEFLQSVLDGTLQVDHLTYKGELPRPVSDLEKTTNIHRVRLDPWFAELETIIASTMNALPFAIRLPGDFASTTDDIGRFRAQPDFNTLFTRWSGLAQSDPVVALLFYKNATALNSRGVDEFLSQNLKDLVDGQLKKPEPGTFCIFTAVDSIDLKIPEVTWRMTKALASRMKEEKWEMVVWRTDCYASTTKSCKAHTWETLL